MAKLYVYDGPVNGWVEITGDAGAGFPVGGTTGQYLRKSSATDYDAAWDTITTDDISDSGQTNKFITQANLNLVASALQPADNISELTNDEGFISDLSSFDTGDLAEGSNLYYTNARVDARITLQAGAANGLATLGADSKIPTSQLPALAITDTFVVASQAAMLALTAEVGDVAVRTDLNKSFILVTDGAGTLANWQELLTPTDSVLSVNGLTGAITLTTTNIAEGTNEYYTAAKVQTVGDARYLQLTGGTLEATDDSPVLELIEGDNAGTGLRLRAHTADFGTSIEFWKDPASLTTTNRLAQITAHGTATGSGFNEWAVYTSKADGSLENRMKFWAAQDETNLILTGTRGITMSSGQLMHIGEADGVGGATCEVMFDDNVGIRINPISRLHIYENTSSTGSTAGVTIEQDSTGDAVLQFLLTATQRYMVGIDNSDSDKFKISASSVLGTTDAITVDTAGLVTIPSNLTVTGDIVLTNGSVDLTAAPATDVTESGVIATLTAGESLVFGDVVYMKSDGKMGKADADAIATSYVEAMALATIANDATGKFLLIGFVRNDAWSWTVGGRIYLSTTAGGLTQTAPSGTDDVVQDLGVATHADRMLFRPNSAQIELV